MSRKRSKPKLSIHPIIRQIIDRDCHVSMRKREVIRHVISKLKGGYGTFRAMARDDRREFMLQCIEVHRQNFELYCDVMTGDFTGRRRRARKRKEAQS